MEAPEASQEGEQPGRNRRDEQGAGQVARGKGARSHTKDLEVRRESASLGNRKLRPQMIKV